MRNFGSIITLSILFALKVLMVPAAQAQTFNLLHTFTGGNDGANPSAGVTMDKAGNLYGTAYAGGGAGYGTVYRLKHKGSGWTFNPLYSFTGGSDGAVPTAPVVFGPDGALYSTTEFGSTNGNVFRLRPSPSACKTALCPWSEDVLYAFQGGTDGNKPIGLLFDPAGNIYGTTSGGGAYGRGTAYELTSSGSGWTESLLHGFGYNIDGSTPYRSVMIFDNAGNLYGTTYLGGAFNAGTVFQLTPSGSGWMETVLYNFQGGSDGRFPYAGLIFDQAGNLYGATTDAGTGGGGTVFELSPSGGGWTYSVLYSLTGSLGGQCGPAWALVMDAGGNLYDTTECDGANNIGNVFKLTNTGGSWTYTSLHDFAGVNDGGFPLSSVTLDTSGNLYGTTYYGGNTGCYRNFGCGVVWEITP